MHAVSQIKSNVYIALLTTANTVYQSAEHRPSLKPQTASNAGVEAWWLGKNP